MFHAAHNARAPLRFNNNRTRSQRYFASASKPKGLHAIKLSACMRKRSESSPLHSLECIEKKGRNTERKRITPWPKVGRCRIVGTNRINRIGEPISSTCQFNPSPRPSLVTRTHARSGPIRTLPLRQVLCHFVAVFRWTRVRLDTSVRPYTRTDCPYVVCQYVACHCVPTYCAILSLCQYVPLGGGGVSWAHREQD